MSWYNIGASLLSIVASQAGPKGGGGGGGGGTPGSSANINTDVFKNIIPMLNVDQAGGNAMPQNRSVEQGPFANMQNPGSPPQSFSGMK